MRGEPDIDRKNPELLQQREHSIFGSDRQADDQHVDMSDACKLDQFRNLAKLGISRHHGRRAAITPVIENTAYPNVIIGLLLDGLDKAFCRGTASDNDG